MAVMEIRPQPFFGNKNRAFWNLQSAGWAGALVLRGLSGIANGQPLSFLVPVIISTITGYSISLLLSVMYKGLIHRRPIVTWGTSIAALVSAAALFAFIDAWVFLIQNPAAESGFGTLFLGAFFLDFTMLGAWSALYYAINFFLRVEEQNDQLLQLETQATRAQLAMLRYQLNPHFLFNTLNAISTLVLSSANDRANEMLTKLSKFLRYSLDHSPVDKVNLAHELETSKLYLDSEKVRFAERLRLDIDIETRAERAMVPTMLLQPLIENSIKYAISQSESGGTIRISAKVRDNTLVVQVADDGPGVPELDGESDGSAFSQGVGKIGRAHV